MRNLARGSLLLIDDDYKRDLGRTKSPQRAWTMIVVIRSWIVIDEMSMLWMRLCGI